ncbi:hypothetical protein Q75_08430 [Bacillus coahuilensis p1.1.43]|uniref:DUF2515 domain-containing protein n=1 Tax=Bacillus coahuilensis p1.1.43 TaxID=1150625 RepID=A0A147K8K8_9BACI|nr:DUF2515 family protein [Bacillus coahuilensis]KUP06539.1 hypothetical protein Q75_08430 [Bacillus coahuilensis p1.1.43]
MNEFARFHGFLHNISSLEEEMIPQIEYLTMKWNLDNISRTKAYQLFFSAFPEVHWSFLASMVSRNAGWNMTDLEGSVFSKLLSSKHRQELFSTYERANWHIFHDAFPQLLLYEYSTKLQCEKFHLLKKFNVSSYMEDEWNYFYKHKNKERLVNSLIINEQNVIQHPLIQHPYYKKNIFGSFLFLFQDWFHFSTVIFPTLHGKLYGYTVRDFTNLSKRIELGKKLYSILFHKDLHEHFLQFSRSVEHSGSRRDYEKYIGCKTSVSPILRLTFPIVSHHIHTQPDWSKNSKIKKAWVQPVNPVEHPELTDWFIRKRKELLIASLLFSTK